MQRPVFYTAVRKSLFGGRLSVGQVKGMDAVLDAWEAFPRVGTADPRWIAYILATAFHETDKQMLPVAEVGKGNHRAYGFPDPVTKQTYYGRGMVQLTWRSNYAEMGDALGLDLENQPDLLLDPKISAQVLVLGMIDGDFTGKKLSDYFFRGSSDPVNARRIVNGTDRAELIAGYYQSFLQAVHAGLDWALA